MKSRASLVLMEQLAMVLVFALAAALCLQGFVRADETACRTARRDEAVVIAQNAAELLKAGGDPETALETGEYCLEIRRIPTDIPGFAQAEVRVCRGEETLFTLQTGWQEEVP